MGRKETDVDVALDLFVLVGLGDDGVVYFGDGVHFCCEDAG